MVALTRSHIRRRYALVQVHTLPDFLVFATLPLRLVGVPVILDLHEAMPEFFSARFGSRPSGVGVRLLRHQERLACRFATAVVTVNRALGDRLVGLGVDPAKVTIVPNAPSLVRFSPTAHPSRAFMADGTLRLVYTGALSPTYELDVAFQAVAQLVRRRTRTSTSAWSCTGATSPRCRCPPSPIASGSPTGCVPWPRSRSMRSRRRSPRTDIGLAPDPTHPIHRLLALDQGVRVRRDGPAGRRIAATDGRGHVR